MNINPAWKDRHKRALRAWQGGDVNGLISLCEDEIRTEAGMHTKDCRGAVSFDECAQAGREAVWKHYERYDPKQGIPFQAFIRRRISGAMTSLIDEHRQLARVGVFKPLNPAKALEELVTLVKSGERDESVVVEQIELALDRISLEDWRYVVESDRAVARYFTALLSQVDFKQLPRKYRELLDMANTEYWRSVFGAAADAGRSPTKISGPLDMVTIQRQNKARNPLAPPISRRKLGKLLGVSDKTIKEWEKRISSAGPPPLLREDGSFTLKTQRDHDEWVDYWNRIADPRSWRRLHKRRPDETP